MRNKWFSTIVVVTLIILSSYTILGSEYTTDSDVNTEVQTVLDVAVNLATPPPDAHLLRFDKVYDYERNRFVWFLEWITKNNNMISVEVDDKSREILYYIDTSKTSPSIIIDDAENINTKVLNEVQQLMFSYGIQRLPEDALILIIERTNNGWNVVWAHEIDSVPIRNDEISITVDLSISKILSYRKVWNDIHINTKPSLTLEEVHKVAFSLHLRDVLSVDSKLVILNAKEIKDYFYLSYEVTFSSKNGKSDIYQIDAHSGSLIEYDSTMLYQDVYANHDFWVPGDLRCAETVFRRLESSTTGTTRLRVDILASRIISYFQVDSLFFHMGHGYYIDVGGGVLHSTIITPDGYIAPSDILSQSCSNMKLAFLGSCLSLGEDFEELGVPKHITYSVGDAFLDSGTDCVVGWKGIVNIRQDWIFSEYFFDKAVSGYDFDACFQYAYSKVDRATQLLAKIEGDDSLTLIEDDQGADYYPGTYLGSGSDIEWNIDDEGLWGIGIDNDWYRFLVSGTQTISVYVVPVDPTLDVVFKVYDMYMNLKYTINYNGLGNSEYISFTGFSTYYVKVYATGTTHGGAYDITISITSS